MVERLLNDLLKTTEGYQTVKNEVVAAQNEVKLNQQALMPLQKDNERLVKENNALHMDIIKAREDLDKQDIQLKSALRQIQNENQDLRFLVDQKDLRIKKQEAELAKARERIEKVMAKTYHPSANEIIEGLSQEPGARKQNIVKGNQDFEMTHPLSKHHNDISDIMREPLTGAAATAAGQPSMDASKASQEWAEELRKADERTEFYRAQVDELKKTKEGAEKRAVHSES